MTKNKIIKIQNLSCSITLVLIITCVGTLSNIRLNIPKLNTPKKSESLDENNNIITFEKCPESVYIFRSNTLITSQLATYHDNIVSISKDPVNEYSGMALSHELEDEYRKIALEYRIPIEAMLIIGDQESDGKWDNNGVISITNDYGVFQINKRNHKYIFEQLGYTSDDLRYDPIKNAEAAALLIRDIMEHPKVKKLNDIFGMYNGWTGWENKEISINYVKECNERLANYFPNFEYYHSDYVDIKMEYYDDDYLIKLICEQAGYAKDSDKLSRLEEFKENILFNVEESKYRQIVFNYNAIESELIEIIKSDKQTDKRVWKQFYNFYLLETNQLLLQNKDDEAMKRYSEMVKALEEYYDIDKNKIELPKNYRSIKEKKLI